MSTPVDVLDALNIRMKNLGFEESNVIFDTARIPATIRDKSYSARFLSAGPDFDRKAINKMLTIERNLEIVVLYKMPTSYAGLANQDKYRDVLDNEETVVKSLVKQRIDSGIVFETIESSTVELVETENGEWLVSTLIFRMKYDINLV